MMLTIPVIPSQLHPTPLFLVVNEVCKAERSKMCTISRRIEKFFGRYLGKTRTFCLEIRNKNVKNFYKIKVHMAGLKPEKLTILKRRYYHEQKEKY